MSSSKRQTTAAKRDREQAVRNKRARKDEKKQAIRDAKAAGTYVGHEYVDEETAPEFAGEPSPAVVETTDD